MDLNRAADDRPPANPDGVVKTATCYARPIYRSGAELTESLTNDLLEDHYFPYHRQLEDAAADPHLRLALDCHSMAATPPQVAPDCRRPRSRASALLPEQWRRRDRSRGADAGAPGGPRGGL